MNEREFLNKIQSIDFNEIIKNGNINGNINVNNILHHIKYLINMSWLLECHTT